MTGLPKLPGFTFTDPTFSKYHLSQTFDLCNGYKLPKNHYTGVGGRELLANSIRYLNTKDYVRFDPSFTYGRSLGPSLPVQKPHYVLYDKKCLTFRAFFKQSVVESPNEFYRVRYVNIIYFLEDDSITVMEPKTPNSGIDQGRLIRKDRILKTDQNYWHWKDFAVGKDVALNGIVFHIVDCDLFTREYMNSQGLPMGEAEEFPPDPYTQNRQLQLQSSLIKTLKPFDDKFRKFLDNDGKILKFDAIWDDRDNEFGELKKFEILYFLADDKMMVKELHTKNDRKDPCPILIKKSKIPKIWTKKPMTFPSIYLELSTEEGIEYYKPSDLLVGETVFILGRRMLIYDCDQFTRSYSKNVLCIEQKPAIDVNAKPKRSYPKKMPPHDGLGSLEDSLQNTFTVLPKPPRKDVIRQIFNANKYLRYEMMMDVIHPEDEIRRFLLLYSLADGTCKIHEPPKRNSGILGGKYLRSFMLKKPHSDPLNPDYYTPADFYIGAIIIVFGQRFKIIGADLYVYRYMQANPGKFPCEIIENLRNYMFAKGYLKDDVNEQVEININAEKKAQRDALGRDLVYPPNEMDECMRAMNAYIPSEDEEKQDFQKPVDYTHYVPPLGIKPINTSCANTILVEPNDYSTQYKHILANDETEEQRAHDFTNSANETKIDERMYPKTNQEIVQQTGQPCKNVRFSEGTNPK